MFHLYTCFNSFDTFTLPSFPAKGPFLSSSHIHHFFFQIHEFVSHLGAISDIRVLRSGLRPRSCASSSTRRSGMRRWAASVERVDMVIVVFGPIVQYSLISWCSKFFEYQHDYQKLELENFLSFESFFAMFFLVCPLLNSARLLTCGASTSTTGGRPTSCSLGARGRGLAQRWTKWFHDSKPSENGTGHAKKKQKWLLNFRILIVHDCSIQTLSLHSAHLQN